MTKPRVYVETSIPSFYVERRTAPDIVARREWTRQWWDNASNQYELVTSPLEIVMKKSQNDPVIDEIREIRHRISARFNHDPTQLVAYYMERQKEYQGRLIASKPVTENVD